MLITHALLHRQPEWLSIATEPVRAPFAIDEQFQGVNTHLQRSALLLGIGQTVNST